MLICVMQRGQRSNTLGLNISLSYFYHLYIYFILCFNFVLNLFHNKVPGQASFVPLNPNLHTQVYPPIVLIQVELSESHSSVPSIHSSTSVQSLPFPSQPKITNNLSSPLQYHRRTDMFQEKLVSSTFPSNENITGSLQCKI